MIELAATNVADDVYASIVIRSTEIVVTLDASGVFVVQWIGCPGFAQESFAQLSDALTRVVALVRDEEELEADD